MSANWNDFIFYFVPHCPCGPEYTGRLGKLPKQFPELKRDGVSVTRGDIVPET